MSAPRSSRFPGWLLLLGALTAIGPLSIDMYLPAFLTIASDLGSARGAVERSLQVFLAGLALGQLFYGPLSDRFGRKPPLLLGLAIYLAGAIGCALAHTVEQLTAARLLQALGGGVGVVVSRAVIRDRLDAQGSARALSTLMLVMGAAPILAPLFGGWMLSATSWRAIFGFQAVYAALMIVVVAFAMQETRRAELVQPLRIGGALRRYADLLRDVRFLAPVQAGAFGMGGMFAYIAGSPFVLMARHGLSESQYALLFGLNAFGLIAASQINGAWLRRTTPQQVLRRTYWLPAAAGLYLLALGLLGQPPLFWLALGLFAYVASMGLILPNTGALALADHAAVAGAASALLGCLSFLAGTIAGLLVSLSDGSSALPLMGVIAVCGVISALSSRRALHHCTCVVPVEEAVVEPSA